MASKHSIDSQLGSVNIFSECSKKELKAISRLVTPVHVEAGRVLTTEGEVGREFMVILEGSARVERGGAPVATLGPGDFFGELAVLAGVPRTATVTAETDMYLEALNRREFSTMLDENPKLAKKVLIGAVKRLYDLDQKSLH
ncbi:MAG: cyclic nucleotide-binding domain-containing protein [Acidobacteria bacterium]|nr:cyclic nucleotide-binding domain-containing protein [Acidobacteriota bacterium]